MSRTTGKTYVRIPLKDARILKEILEGKTGSSQAMRLVRMQAESSFFKALEKAEHREAVKQGVAEEIGEGDWGRE